MGNVGGKVTENTVARSLRRTHDSQPESWFLESAEGRLGLRGARRNVERRSLRGGQRKGQRMDTQFANLLDLIARQGDTLREMN
jgi:hypothetical protein